jgi:hypothetical protein
VAERGEEVRDLFLKMSLFFQIDGSVEKHTKLVGSKITVVEVICSEVRNARSRLILYFKNAKIRGKGI